MMSSKNRYAVLGGNVKNSLSPVIFEYWFKKYNINSEYSILEEKTLSVELIKKISSEYNGINITYPYKESINNYLNTKNEPINIIKFDQGEVKVFNSDGIGFLNSVNNYSDIKFNQGQMITILGGGGAAKIIGKTLLEKNKNLKINFVIRKKERQKEISEKLIEYRNNIEYIYLSEFMHISSKTDILVNTIPYEGEYIEFLDKNLINIKKNLVIVDIVYIPYYTFLKNFSKKHNLKYLGGVYMLLEQAAVTFEYWFGFQPFIDNELISIIENICKH